MTHKRVRVYVPANNTTHISKKQRKEIIQQTHLLQKSNNNNNNSNNNNTVNIELYQQASSIGHSSQENNSFNSSKWIIPLIKRHFKQQINNKQKMKLLDVGSLCNHYNTYNNILDIHAIDINSMHPTVQKIDFFDLRYRTLSYDVIVCSLVLNYIGDKFKRGLMLQRCYDMLHNNISSNHNNNRYFYLVLPKACLFNSRYLTVDIFNNDIMLNHIGFKCTHTHVSNKLILLEYVTVNKNNNNNTTTATTEYKPNVILKGDKHNNFSIALK